MISKPVHWFAGRKSMDWFLYDNGLRHERVKGRIKRHYLEIEFSDLFEFDHNTGKLN